MAKETNKQPSTPPQEGAAKDKPQQQNSNKEDNNTADATSSQNEDQSEPASVSENGTLSTDDSDARDRKNRKRKTREEEDGADPVCFACVSEDGKLMLENHDHSIHCPHCKGLVLFGSEAADTDERICTCDRKAGNEEGEAAKDGQTTEDSNEVGNFFVCYLFIYVLLPIVFHPLPVCSLVPSLQHTTFETINYTMHLLVCIPTLPHFSP